MDSHAENTRRIAKNTLMLYVRMLFGMLVSLYTSRVVLNTLGVEDYGIYNVVGGVIGLLGFLTGSLGAASSAYLTFDLGRYISITGISHFDFGRNNRSLVHVNSIADTCRTTICSIMGLSFFCFFNSPRNT